MQSGLQTHLTSLLSDFYLAKKFLGKAEPQFGTISGKIRFQIISKGIQSNAYLGGEMAAKLFTKLKISSPSNGLMLANRIVVAPMCQYSSKDGNATDWHLFHWSNMLNSGAGVFIIEATAVNPAGRITPYCLGLYNDATQNSLSDKLNRARKLAPKMPVFIQLAHAGRKASSAIPWEGGQLLEVEKGGWPTVSASTIPHLPNERQPHQLTQSEINSITADFIQAAKRVNSIDGIDGIELHAAHGYLLHQFLSPISNQRNDSYGGSLENRFRFVTEIFTGVRKVWKGVLGVRISATDWVENGWDIESSIKLVKRLKELGLDYIHVSSGGISPLQKISLGPNYQVPFAKMIKEQTGLTTIAVGLITDPHQAQEIINKNEADGVALARAFLWNPRWGWQAANTLKEKGVIESSSQYWRCLPRGANEIFADMKMGQR
jgi:2,4-dienoyl-CoA reductase-like NADH-dependent reductase (Old Yellow Enzyme family)